MKNGRPYGFPPAGYPEPQGGYYCGVGEDEIDGMLDDRRPSLGAPPGRLACRSRASTPRSCPVSGSSRPARWVCSGRRPTALPVGSSIGSGARMTASPPPSTPSPPRVTGTALAPTPTSPRRRCEDGGYKYIEAGCKALGTKAQLHIDNYGDGIEDRLTGAHETRVMEVSYGVSDRGASIRIPWQVAVDKKDSPRRSSPERQHRPVHRRPPHGGRPSAAQLSDPSRPN